MRNKMMFRVLALIFLFLLVPGGLCAETAPCPFDTPRAREVWANAPQTPEALLRVLKAFMDNPQMNGFELGEKILGIARENWGAPYSFGTYSPFRSLEPPTRYSNGKLNPNRESPVPYYFEDGNIDLDKNGDLVQFTLLNFKKTFCLTPALTRGILGEPTRITLGDSGLSLVYTMAHAQREYGILISYKSMQMQPRGDRNYSRTIIKDKQEFQRIFEDRKNSCVTVVSVFIPSGRGQQ